MTRGAGPFSPPEQERPGGRLVIRNVRLVERTSGRPGRPCHVLVENGRIAALAPDPIDAGDASVIEAGGGVMIAGFVDCHVRLFEADGAAGGTAGSRDVFVARGAGEADDDRQAHRTCEAHDIEGGFERLVRLGSMGFAAVCDVSGVDAGIRDLLERAIPSAPRLLISGEPIGAAVQSDGRPVIGRSRALCPCCEPPQEIGLSSGDRIVADRAWTSLHLRADRLRVVLSRFDPLLKRPMDDPSVSTQALVTIIGEASRQNRIVTVLAHTPSAITRAVEAGASAIEEGSFLDARSADLMAARGAFFIPLLSKLTRHVESAQASGHRGGALESARRLAEGTLRAVELARRSGVRIAFGSGSDGRDPTAQLQEWSLLGSVLSASDLIAAATTAARDLLRYTRDTPNLTVGSRADLVVLDGDPFEDIRNLGRIRFRHTCPA